MFILFSINLVKFYKVRLQLTLICRVNKNGGSIVEVIKIIIVTFFLSQLAKAIHFESSAKIKYAIVSPIYFK